MALAVVGGGRRSGKSRYALALARAHGPRLGFIATLEPDDEESREKVEAARRERGPGFATVEAPLELTAALSAQLLNCDAVVVDDLTTWVSNQVMAGATDEEIEQRASSLTSVAVLGPAESIIVTSDVDLGFPMDNEPSRRFRRLAGLINRAWSNRLPRLLDGVWRSETDYLTEARMISPKIGTAIESIRPMLDPAMAAPSAPAWRPLDRPAASAGWTTSPALRPDPRSAETVSPQRASSPSPPTTASRQRRRRRRPGRDAARRPPVPAWRVRRPSAVPPCGIESLLVNVGLAGEEEPGGSEFFDRVRHAEHGTRARP